MPTRRSARSCATQTGNRAFWRSRFKPVENLRSRRERKARRTPVRNRLRSWTPMQTRLPDYWSYTARRSSSTAIPTDRQFTRLGWAAAAPCGWCWVTGTQARAGSSSTLTAFAYMRRTRRSAWPGRAPTEQKPPHQSSPITDRSAKLAAIGAAGTNTRAGDPYTAPMQALWQPAEQLKQACGRPSRRLL